MDHSHHRTGALRPKSGWQIQTFLGRLEQRFFAATALDKAAARTSADEPPTVRAGLRVLVADDNPAALNEVGELLAEMGVAMLAADDGAQAVALARGGNIDLVLMDLQMPVLDGLGATKQIRQDERDGFHARVAVVAYTSRACDWQLMRDCGVDAVLSKPCSEESLRKCIARWCEPEGAGRVEPTKPVGPPAVHR
jgi:CheY-like chemotaxis protein